MLVCVGQLFSDLLGYVVQLIERLGVVEAAQSAIVIVAGYAMIAATVHIQRRQREPLGLDVRIESLEQEVGQVIVHIRIKVLALVDQAAAQVRVDAALSKRLYRLEDGLLDGRIFEGSVVSVRLGERASH